MSSCSTWTHSTGPMQCLRRAGVLDPHVRVAPAAIVEGTHGQAERSGSLACDIQVVDALTGELLPALTFDYQPHNHEDTPDP